MPVNRFDSRSNEEGNPGQFPGEPPGTAPTQVMDPACIRADLAKTRLSL